jgi:hypothetical protein
LAGLQLGEIQDVVENIEQAVAGIMDCQHAAFLLSRKLLSVRRLVPAIVEISATAMATSAPSECERFTV